MTELRWVTDRARPPTSEVDRLLASADVRGLASLPGEPWDLTDRGLAVVVSVADADDVAAVVLAAARGVDVVVGCADPELRSRLIDDLRRIGPVDDVGLGSDPLDVLDDDQRALLRSLASGSSISAAADELYLSTRTAERRLSAARKALGVRTTAEAIAVALG